MLGTGHDGAVLEFTPRRVEAEIATFEVRVCPTLDAKLRQSLKLKCCCLDVFNQLREIIYHDAAAWLCRCMSADTSPLMGERPGPEPILHHNLDTSLV